MAPHAHSHSHEGEKSILHASKTCRLGTVLALTIGFFFVELICGYILHSVAIFADAIHMLSDSGALIIAMVSVRISKRKSAKNTFGWVRAQELGAMVNCILLMSLCFTILVQAVKRLISIEPIDQTRLKLYIIVGLVGLGINLMALAILGGDMSHGHSHGGDSKKSKSAKDNKKDEEGIEIGEGEHLCADEQNDSENHHGHSHGPKSPVLNGDQNVKKKKKKGLDGSQMNIRGAFLHVLNDALGSVIVVLAGLAMKQWPDKTWVNYIDPLASLLMISMIVVFTIPLLRESALVLLQTAPMHIEVADLQKRLVEQVPGVLAVHEFHVWQLSGSKIIASAHIRCHNLSEYMAVAEQVKDFFHTEGIHSTTIQPEFIDEEIITGTVSDKECILECLKDCSMNTCCGQPSSYVKQRVPRIEDNLQRLPTETIVPSIEIISPTRSNSYVE
ncbi:unnamed protein product [Rotaria socialis]|uniref:Zinc transporter 1 n=1 Tax=Rotaria socialis TaxID=392032 RepID=A0A818EI04_9BILA|nr:unnamed protein product [Rotaria socialis]CAF3319947.1 unnamed protein product [Rotaria socialis]CAF3408556.1 unnamed protein product [Rotaria socialis]CAF3413074.1 unnamed protein product [Rotaria socialis]CAF3459008.1 unnamed protein product [Rotaria socialis]